MIFKAALAEELFEKVLQEIRASYELETPQEFIKHMNELFTLLGAQAPCLDREAA